MADYVKFTKEGLREYRWNSDTKDYDCSVPDENMSNLRSKCEIDEGVTLGDIFNAVEADPLLKAVVAGYAWCREIDAFHAQAKEPVPADYDEKLEKPEDKLVYLELLKTAEAHSYPKKKKLKSWFDTGVHFCGMSVDGVGWGVSYSPMWQIVDLPVKLNTDCEIRHNHTDILWTGETYFSLLDVLDGIYWDISFQGGPEDNKAFLESLGDMMDEIKAGTATTVPFDFHELEDEAEEEK